MKRNHAILALLLAVCLLFPNLALASGSSGISNLRGTPYSAIHIQVNWSGSASSYHVNYKPVEGSFSYYKQAYGNSALLTVAPSTVYEITVNAVGGSESEPIYVTTPPFSTTREYNYRYMSFALYSVNANSNQDFFDDGSRTRLERVQSSQLASSGTLRDFFAVSDFTVSETSSSKEIPYVVVMIPPRSGDKYLSTGTISVPARWTSVLQSYYLGGIIETYLKYEGSFARGTYQLEVYLNGWLGGKTTFIVE